MYTSSVPFELLSYARITVLHLNNIVLKVIADACQALGRHVLHTNDSIKLAISIATNYT